MVGVLSVANLGDSILTSFTAALTALLAFIPALLGALIVLVIGWVLSGVIARLVMAVLQKVGFNGAAERVGVGGFMERAGTRDARPSWLIAQLVKWFIRLIFLEAAAQILHMNTVTGLLNSIILWIPNLIVALVILLLGALLADFLGRLVQGSAGSAGMGNPYFLASLTEVGVMALAVIIALNQVGIAKELVDALFIGFVAAMALALGLAFGLGGRDTAAQLWRAWAEGRVPGPALPSRASGGTGATVRQSVEGQPVLATSTTVEPGEPTA